MAIKRTLTAAVPYSEGGKVTRWELEMQYEQGTEGEADYYTNTKRATINAVDKSEGPDGKEVVVNNFTAKAEADWSKSDLEALCPTAKWDEIFASQYDSVITNPKVSPEPNTEFTIPS